MQKIFITLLFCLTFGAVSASAQKDYCFQSDGLKVKQIVSFTLTGSKIEGTFESGGYDADTSMETFDFTGTKAGNLLTIKFDRGKPPYETARGTKRIVWTLGAKALQIPVYGKNYDTKKYSTYSSRFDQCRNN